MRHGGKNSASSIPDFNSRTHVECDEMLNCLGVLSDDFNSRTHVECDVAEVVASGNIIDFNSRTHVECDGYMQRLVKHRIDISTHALTWSATINFYNPIIPHRNFNSRTHVECDSTN